MASYKEQRLKELQAEQQRITSTLNAGEDAQQKPKATGAKYRRFDVYLCVIELVNRPFNGRPKWFLNKARVGEQIYTRNVEPHLVYGSKRFNTVGFNDNILLDQGIPCQIWFPKDTVKTGDVINCGNIIIPVLINVAGKSPIIAERSFNFFEYKGSPTLKEQAAACRGEYEYLMPEEL